jgi:hypothetical protein
LSTFLDKTQICKDDSVLGPQYEVNNRKYHEICIDGVEGSTSTESPDDVTTTDGEDEELSCTTQYVQASGAYQRCNFDANTEFEEYTEAQKQDYEIGNNPHPACRCVREYGDATRSCADDPIMGTSIKALLAGIKRAKWMETCRD